MKRLLGLTGLFISTMCSAQGTPGADMVVANVVDNLKRAAQDIIHQLDQTASVNSFQIRQHLLVTISEVEHAALTVQDKTFKDLDKQQQALFQGAENTIAAAKAATTAPLDKLGDISKTVENAVARLPLADKSPRIARIRPDHLLAPTGAAPVRLVVEGSFLAYGPARLEMDGQSCTLASQTDAMLAFHCPASTFATVDGFRNVTGSLVVADRKEFWERVKHVFRNYEAKKNYRSLVVAVPPKLGDYALEVGYASDTQEPRAASAPFESGNPHCVGQRDYSLNYAVQNGPAYTILPGSVTFTATSGNGERSMAGPLDFTPKGFRMQATLKNGGDCGPRLPFSSSRAWYDARAWLGGTVAWTEVRTVTAQKVDAAPPTPLLWGSDVVLDLPERLSYFKLSIRQVDGSKPIVINADNTQRWFKVEKTDRVLKISPRQVEDALRL
ncbi:hypothetical protein [uncultured Massilia sp.]|uniref:hypothetical protein n=1 Tax=uncultured Massilia sp. TaxID=169973 RepID=UPI0025CCB29A|nr:hypothetical protein [uncultured Massilia sp.]